MQQGARIRLAADPVTRSRSSPSGLVRYRVSARMHWAVRDRVRAQSLEAELSWHVAVSPRMQRRPVITLANSLGPDRVLILHAAGDLASTRPLITSRAPSPQRESHLQVA